MTDTPYTGICIEMLCVTPCHPHWCHNDPQPYGTIRCQNCVLSQCCPSAARRPSFAVESWCPELCYAHVAGHLHLPLSVEKDNHATMEAGICMWQQHTATPGQGRPAHSALPVLPQALRAQKSFEFKCPHHHPATTSRSRCWYR